MLEQVGKFIQGECRLDPERPVLAGISGGPDSLALLDLLHRLGIPVVVAHLNHRLRPEAEQEARRVAEIAESYGLPFVLDEQDVAGYAGKNALSIEEAARELRYRFLFDAAQEHTAQAVAVGHTADDQVETVLMHLLRGAGLSGLKGMLPRVIIPSWNSELPLVRPLLAVWREEVLTYCQTQGLQPHIDASNLDTAYFRNRLRHELIPYLEEYNPNLRRSLWRMTQILASDHQVLEEVVESAWETCILEEGQGYVALSRQEFLNLPVGTQRSLMRRAIRTLRPGLRDIGFDAIHRALEFFTLPPQTGQADLISGLCLKLEGERVWLAAWEADLPDMEWPQMGGSEPLPLEIPGEIQLEAGWMLQSSQTAYSRELESLAESNEDPFQVWIDADKIPPRLEVRPRRPGDRFTPLGMEGSSPKLADFMINVKLPRRARAAWPLVTAGGEIVWLPGYRLAHPYRLTQDTRQVIHLRLTRLQEDEKE